MKRKVELTLKQMVEAVKVNGKEPWNVLDISRGTWFRNLSKNGVTMVELQSQSQSQNIETSANSANVPTHTIRPVPQWQPNVANEANTVGRGKAILKKLIKEEERGFLDNNSLKELARIMCDYCGCPEKYERLVEYL